MTRYNLEDFAIKYDSEMDISHEDYDILVQDPNLETELREKIEALSSHCQILDSPNGVRLKARKDGKKIILSPIMGDLPRFNFHSRKKSYLDIQVDPYEGINVTLESPFYRSIEPSGKIEYVLKLFPEQFQ